jgi:uncharacterized protein
VNENKKIKRNVVIYVIGILLLAVIAIMVAATGNAAGVQIFFVGPILMMVLLRFFGGDGWKDAGLSLKLKESWHWYLFSLFVYPITISAVIVMGIILGMTRINGNLTTLLPAFFAGMATLLIPKMLFAMFEEWGWRGYLEPRLAALGVPDIWRHLFVGLVWAVWHFPLFLTPGFTEIHYAIFFPLFVISVMLAAIVYGQLRKASGTVWTSVLMHGIANTFGGAIIQMNLLTINNKLVANTAPESVLSILIFCALVWWILYRRKA